MSAAAVTYSSAIAAAKLKFDDAESKHKKFVDSGLCDHGKLVSLSGSLAQAFRELIRTPSTRLDDVGLKVTISVRELDELEEVGARDCIPALMRVLIAIRNGSASTAAKHLDAVLCGDTVKACVYRRLEIALEDLRRLEVAP